MKLVTTGAFDRLQQSLVIELIYAIKREIESVEVPQEIIKQLTGSIAFSVASLIDDVAGIEHGGEQISPMLTFLIEEEKLEFAGGNSWMHEYIYPLIPTVFGE